MSANEYRIAAALIVKRAATQLLEEALATGNAASIRKARAYHKKAVRGAARLAQ